MLTSLVTSLNSALWSCFKVLFPARSAGMADTTRLICMKPLTLRGYLFISSHGDMIIVAPPVKRQRVINKSSKGNANPWLIITTT
jgi:hypothetical protein